MRYCTAQAAATSGSWVTMMPQQPETALTPYSAREQRACCNPSSPGGDTPSERGGFFYSFACNSRMGLFCRM